MKTKLIIGLLIISLILIAGCSSTGNVVKDVDTGNIVSEGDKIELSLGVDNSKEFYCSAVKPLINCYCSENGGCWLGGAVNYRDGEYITIQQIKNDVYDEQENLIFSKTEDIQIVRFLTDYPLQNTKIGDKVKTTITKIKYAKVQDYDCEVVNEIICSDEHFVIKEDKL